jgi:hypothetical protein
MTHTLIGIDPYTLDLIEALNNGVRPEIEEIPAYFLYKGKDEIPEILTEKQLVETIDLNDWRTTFVVVKNQESK